MGSINKLVSRFETTAVYTHPDAKVDIVLVHGLNGDPQKTWTSKDGTFWPTDLLPSSLRDAHANVLVYGYNADVYSKKHGGSPSDNFLYMHAQSLVTSLTHYRKDEMSSRNPIIWVCHSLGGILVKRALLYSNDLRALQHEDYRQIYVSTFGIIFLGTPHTGSDMGVWAATLQAMSDAVVPKAFWQSEPVLLKTLKKDNETLQNINNHFLDIYQRFQIMMAHENHKTDLKGTKMLVVDAQSASPQLPGVAYFSIEATHSGMCKFDSKNAPGYRVVATAIRDWVEDAPDVISMRWRVEEEERLARAQHEIAERMEPWLNSQVTRQRAPRQAQGCKDNCTHSTDQNVPAPIETPHRLFLEPPALGQTQESLSQGSSSDTAPNREPIFVKPSVFRPNTYFKGREKALKELHEMLMDRERRSKGTSSVLVQSLPGGGKTHLARQYVFQHKYDYPGGIFWLRSKSLVELEYGYWDIAKTMALKEVETLHEDGLSDTMEMVKVVQRWLSRTENWLLVLDGVHFDIPHLEAFIPFAKNSSIIYTSTEKTTGEEYLFDNPQVLALEPLTSQEAQELLLEEMEKKKPWTQDDLDRAHELTELMDKLPLMVHVAARHLKTTREPLSRYIRSYSRGKGPNASNMPAYRAVRDQLMCRGQMAALNLMSMIAFFGQHIPVEMLVLGLKSLDKRTPIRSYDTETHTKTFNNTFKVLIAYALIERNENTNNSSSSDRDSCSVDMDQDSCDSLRIHGIVQQFFVDTLAEEKQAPFWLDRAICVFCGAFDESARRIEEDEVLGMPEDYLRFEIHGKKLLTYLERFEKKNPALGECRDLLEARLASIRARVDQLTQRNRKGRRESQEPPISVFERANSLSELDTATPTSNDDDGEWNVGEGSGGIAHPANVDGTPGYNPYHWHTTHPHSISPPNIDTSGPLTSELEPAEVLESITFPEEPLPHQTADRSHRTVKRNAERRYRDHAGSWRAAPQILSDPRVSLSRETASGFLSPPAAQTDNLPPSTSSRTRIVAKNSEAEMTLNKITKTSPPPQRGSGHIHPGGKSRTSSGASSSLRPTLIPGRRGSFAGAPQTSEAVADDFEHPVIPTFAGVMGTSPPTAASSAEAILRLKQKDHRAGDVTIGGLKPVKVSSPLTSDPLTTATSITPSSSTLLDHQLQQQQRPVQGRSLKSGPSDLDLDTADERDIEARIEQWTQSLPPPPAVRPASPTPSPPYPTVRPVSPTSSLPYPTAKTVRAELPLAALAHPQHPPPPWTPSALARPDEQPPPQGYSSQPMSRDTSHQSKGSSTGPGPARLRRKGGSPLLLAQAQAQAQSGGGASISISGSASGSVSGSVLEGGSGLLENAAAGPQQILQRPHSRRPSLVETEPSPRLRAGGSFAEGGGSGGGGVLLETPPTSYELYENGQRKRRRAGSDGPKRSGL